jgi:hypothetical protein
LAKILRFGLAAVLILAAACSDNLASLEELSGQSQNPFAFSDAEVEAAIAEAEATDPSEIQAGSDRAASEAIAAELEAAGVDLTGVELSVWPLPGDGRTVLILGVTDETPGISDDSAGAESLDPETLLATLVNGTTAAEARIARLALQYTGEVEGKQTEIALTLPMSDIEEGVRTGVDVTDRALVQVTEVPDA